MDKKSNALNMCSVYYEFMLLGWWVANRDKFHNEMRIGLCAILQLSIHLSDSLNESKYSYKTDCLLFLSPQYPAHSLAHTCT